MKTITIFRAAARRVYKRPHDERTEAWSKEFREMARPLGSQRQHHRLYDSRNATRRKHGMLLP